MIALVRLDGLIEECTAKGAEECFGLSTDDVLKENILNLMDSSLDQLEFRKLVQGTIACDTVDADMTCLLRTKGKRIFIWADRPASTATASAASLADFIAQRRPVPDIAEASSSDKKRIKSGEKVYYALDTADMSFNDVFEDPGSSALSVSLSSTSNVPSIPPSRSHSDQSLSEIPSNIGHHDPDITPEDDSNWGWFKIVSPSSSASLNRTQQIRVVAERPAF